MYVQRNIITPKKEVKVKVKNKYRVIMTGQDADISVSVINMNGGVPVFCRGNVEPWQKGRSEKSFDAIICDVEADVVEVAVKLARRLAVVFLEQRYHVTFSFCENVGGYDCRAKSAEDAIRKARLAFGLDWNLYGGKRAFAFDVDGCHEVGHMKARMDWQEGRKIQRQI